MRKTVLVGGVGVGDGVGVAVGICVGVGDGVLVAFPLVACGEVLQATRSVTSRSSEALLHVFAI